MKRFLLPLGFFMLCCLPFSGLVIGGAAQCNRENRLRYGTERPTMEDICRVECSNKGLYWEGILIAPRERTHQCICRNFRL